MRVGVIGCGLIGRRRAAAVAEHPLTELVIAADPDRARAEAVTRESGGRATTEWREVVERDDVDAVIVSATNDVHAPATVAAAKAGKHVLCEKPMGRNPGEAEAMVATARAHSVVLKTGFNHRYHPMIRKAQQLCAEGAIGAPLFARGVYGHGGRAGYDKEWRGDPDRAGGGELLDQGVHLIDLFRWFMGDFVEVTGFTARFVWEVGPLEDNGFALLRTAAGQIATLHSSWTQWRNRFTLEIFGRDGHLIVDGLGGSYGPERLVWGRRRLGGAPEEQTFQYNGPDRSWYEEWSEFASAVHDGRMPLGSGVDGLEAMRLIYAIYASAREGRVMRPEGTR